MERGGCLIAVKCDYWWIDSGGMVANDFPKVVHSVLPDARFHRQILSILMASLAYLK